MDLRERAILTYLDNRRRSTQLFAIPADDVFYERPIRLRNPIIFYEGHLPAFSFNTLIKRALGGSSIRPDFEQLFARGIDPDAEPADVKAAWPSRAALHDFIAEADRRILDALHNDRITVDEHEFLHLGEAVEVILEHEQMHHETLLYMFHRLPLTAKRPIAQRAERARVDFDDAAVAIPEGRTTLGQSRSLFGWDNEFDAHVVDVPAFRIDRHSITNAAFVEFVEAGGYKNRELWNDRAWDVLLQQKRSHPLNWERSDGEWLWRGMFELTTLAPDWPVYVTLDEAMAFARWKNARIMTEGEYHRAAFAAPDGEERPHPWGFGDPRSQHGNFGFERWDPEPVGSHPEGASAWGVHDLVGNGWEWTMSSFTPFDGFRPMANYPEYSADFFDTKHFVMKGASPVTDRRMIRRSFRNWFRPDYPFVYAKFRLVY